MNTTHIHMKKNEEAIGPDTAAAKPSERPKYDYAHWT